jgi:Flp pilus assembly pilin Flp
MKALMTRLVREDEGQDLIEYGLLIGLMTALLVAAIPLLGGIVYLRYQAACAALGGAC